MTGEELAEQVLIGYLGFAQASLILRVEIICAALRHHRGNISKTAASLNINRTTLTEIVKKYVDPDTLKMARKKRRPRMATYSFCPECRCPTLPDRPCHGCLAIESALESIRASHRNGFYT